jgi:hypothetical protein
MRLDLAYIKKKLLALQEVGAIDVTMSKGDKLIISMLHLRRKDNKLVKLGESPRLGSIQEIAKALPGKVPLVVTLHGKGVLMRKASADVVNPVAHFLPGSNPGEFYWEAFAAGWEWYVFIARRTWVDEVLEQISALGYEIVHVKLGAGGIGNILPYLDRTKPGFRTYTYDVRLNDGSIEGMEVIAGEEEGLVEESLLGDLYFKDLYLPGLGAALETLVQGVDGLSGGLDLPRVAQSRKEVEYRRYFSLASWLVLGSLLGALLVNYILFSHYFDSNRTLATSRALALQTADEEDRLRAQVEGRYAFLDSLGWLVASRHSFDMDRIAELIPGSISLSGFDAAPPVETDGYSTAIAFHRRLLRISGTCDDPEDLNLFIGSLKNLDFIQEVSLESYAYKRELATSQFIVKVQTRE